MALLANFVAYQTVWLAVIWSAAAARPLLGIGAALTFIAVQLAVSRTPSRDAGFAVLAVACGLAVDGALAHFGYVAYASHDGALPAPAWILALWAAFAMTLDHSLRWLLGSPLLAATLGALGGPLAYAAASRLGAIALASSTGSSLAAIGVGWALALALFAAVGDRTRKPRAEATT